MVKTWDKYNVLYITTLLDPEHGLQSQAAEHVCEDSRAVRKHVSVDPERDVSCDNDDVSALEPQGKAFDRVAVEYCELPH